MNKTNLIIIAILAVLAVVAFNLFNIGNGTGVAIQNYNPAIQQHGFQLGENGGAIYEMRAGTCNFITAGGTSATFTASSTKTWDCAVTGVTAGDIVISSLPTTTPSVANSIACFPSASSTAGYITFKCANASGAAVTLGPTTIGSSTPYVFFDITN